MNTTGANNNSRSPFGGNRLKRVPITIQYKNKPETAVPGYALTHEILPEQISFFAAQKFPVDEELVVTYTMNSGESQTMHVVLRNMHEQISSGRVMNALPSENQPFPARKFYRCYSLVLKAGEMSGTVENNEAAAPAGEPAASIENPVEENKAA